MTSLLDAPPETTGAASYVGVVGTIAAHAVLIGLASLAGAKGVTELTKLLPVTEMVEVDLPPPPAPTPAPEPDPTPAPARVKAPAPQAAAEPPSAAQAGEVLDAKSDVVDFGDTFVTGTGDSYAGGVTDRQGTAKTAVRDVTARGDGAGVAPKPAPAVDLSRPPRLAGGLQWQIPFPLEADDAGIDHAVVTLRVDVGPDGAVRSVSVLNDPGNGFGRETRRYATSRRWEPGLDRNGQAIGTSMTVNVRFDR